MARYDPLTAPDAEAWLAMDEGERIDLAQDYHRRKRIKAPNEKAHAVIHAVIENQLAEGVAPAVSALERMLAEGLDRHEAIHALGTVLAKHLSALMRKSSELGSDPNAHYLAALDKLSAASWRESG